jgi:DNA (cytosine-5)-methyltransferase 1
LRTHQHSLFGGGVRVIGELAAMGYDCRWGVVSAADAIWSYGSPCLDHLRERIWIAGTLRDSAGPRFEPGESQASGPIRDFARRQESKRRGGVEGNEDSHSNSRNGSAEWNILQGGGKPDAVRSGEKGSDADDSGRIEQRTTEPTGEEYEAAERGSWWAAEPGLGRMAHGVAHRVDRLEAIGDGQVPAVVKFAWEILKP